MFLGNRTKRQSTFLYHTVFCVRRLFLVLSFFIYYISKNPKVIWCFLAIQSLYLLYIISNTPHNEDYFNNLEIFNEICIILLLYMSFGFWRNPDANFTWLDSKTNWNCGYLAINIISVIFVLNFGTMIYMTVKKCKLHYIRYAKRNKAKVVMKKRKGYATRRGSSLFNDAVDAIGNAMIDVIDEDDSENKSSSYIENQELENVRQQTSRQSPHLKMSYDAKFPWFSNRMLLVNPADNEDKLLG